MQAEKTPLFQSVVELFLTRYHLRMREEGSGGSESDYRFLLRYGVDPEFRAAVERELGADLSKAESREELGFVLTLELVLSRNGHRLFEQIVSKEKLEELEGIYPEVFGKGRGDMGLGSAYDLLCQADGLHLEMGQKADPLVRALDDLFPEGADAEGVLAAIRRQAYLLNIETTWMGALEGFQATVSKDVDKLLTALGEREEVDRYQAKRVRSRGEAVEMVFCVASEAVALRWFDSLDEMAANQVLASSSELMWDESSIAKGMDLRMNWSESPREGALAIMHAAESLRQYGRVDASLSIYRSLLEREGVDDRSLAEAHNRMAVVHREEGRWHEAHLEFQEAAILWEMLGAKWEEAVTASLVAEGYGRAGKRSRAERYLTEAFSLLDSLEEGDERMAQGYFYLATCANSLGRLDLERVALQKGIGYAQSLENGNLFVEFNERLLALHK